MHLIVTIPTKLTLTCLILLVSSVSSSPSSSQAGSPFREPLIKFLTRHPSQTVELFMMEATLNDPQWSRMFMVRLWQLLSSSPLSLLIRTFTIKQCFAASVMAHNQGYIRCFRGPVVHFPPNLDKSPPVKVVNLLFNVAKN